MASAGVFECDGEGRVIVYSDGSVLNNGVPGLPKRGGIGVYFGPNHKLNYSGPVEGKPTNNVAEIQAATKALQLCHGAGRKKVHLKSDSTQVTEAMNEWLEDWLEHNWWTTDYDTGEPKRVANEMEYKKLLAVAEGMNVKYVHVAGHARVQGNIEADRLANEGAKTAPVYFD